MINRYPWFCRFVLLFFFITAITLASGQTAADTSLPLSLSNHLDSLRKTDNLEEWLYTYTEYVQKSPANRVGLLTRAQQLKWRDARSHDEQLAWFNFLTNLGYYHLFTGNILFSIEAYEGAYRFYFDHPMPQETDVLEYVLKPLGNNYTRLGDYERAFFIHEKSLSLALEKNNKEQIPSIYSNLAICARWKGDLGQAQQFAEKGLQTVTKNTALHGLLLSTLADILFQSKDLEKAGATAKEAIQVLQQKISSKEANANTAYWLESAYQVQGNILKEKGDLPGALASYTRATYVMDHQFKGVRKREKAKLLVLTGDALLAMNQAQQAVAQYNEALAILVPEFKIHDINDLPSAAGLYGENTLQDALNGKARYLSATNQKEAALQCYTLLFSVEQKLRHELFSRTALQQQQKENRQWVESAIDLAYDLWKTMGKPVFAQKILQMAEMSKSQLLLEEMISNLQYHRIKSKDTLLVNQLQTMQAIALYEKEAVLNQSEDSDNTLSIKKELQYKLSLINKQVREKYPMLRGYMVEDLPSADSLLQSIPANTTVVEFFTGQKNIYVISAKKGSVEQILRPDSSLLILQSIKDFVFNWFQQGAQKMMNDPQGYYTNAWQIYHWLLEGIKLGKQSQCLVIPDNIIGYLPFDALVTEPSYRANIDQWPFLIKNVSLFTAYSLQAYQQQQRIERKNSLFAGFFISFDSSQVALPAVKKEYSTIHDVVGGKYFTDQQATAGAFKDNLAQVNLLHISTHSFLEGEEHIPVLQMANDRFFLFELYGQSFQPQLVVLSACRTGHGLLAEGEGIISLARGFTASGAGGIVAGLWNMHDETTADLVGIFYRELAKNHLPADALHAAKLQWLLSEHDQNFKKLPYFWAGLVYVGDNQPVALTLQSRFAGWLPYIGWAGGLIVIVLVRRYSRRKKRSMK